MVKFTDVTQQLAPGLKDIGMVCDAVWSDFDNDGWMDMLIVGEWMPLKFLKNEHGKLIDATAGSGISDQSGWWSSVAKGDFDNDGDDDFIVGNLGKNSFYKASDKYPVTVYAKDFYDQGTTQCVITTYLNDTAEWNIKGIHRPWQR